jgi:tetratricopeptide (TPR) repeat protein
MQIASKFLFGMVAVTLFACSPSDTRPSASKGPAFGAGAPPAPKSKAFPSNDDLASHFRIGRGERKAEVEQFGSMTQDHAQLVGTCAGKSAPEVLLVAGVVHVPYRDAAALQRVAERTAEKVLNGATPPAGCQVSEVLYWVRDDEGGGDYVVRYPSASGESSSLWFVDDAGQSSPSLPALIRPRVFVDRLLRVASYKADFEEDIPGALGLVGEARRLAPSSASAVEVWLELVAGSDPRGALMELDAWEKGHGSTADLQATRAEILLAVGDVSEVRHAEELLLGILERRPEHVKALAVFAERLRSRGDLEGALRNYRVLLQAHPKRAAPRYNVATLLQERGDVGGAIRELGAYLETYDEDVDALFLRSTLRLQSGDLPGSAADFQRLQKRAPQHPDVITLGKKLAEASSAGTP